MKKARSQTLIEPSCPSKQAAVMAIAEGVAVVPEAAAVVVADAGAVAMGGTVVTAVMGVVGINHSMEKRNETGLR